jgi:hypothetical protein
MVYNNRTGRCDANSLSFVAQSVTSFTPPLVIGINPLAQTSKNASVQGSAVVHVVSHGNAEDDDDDDVTIWLYVILIVLVVAFLAFGLFIIIRTTCHVEESPDEEDETNQGALSGGTIRSSKRDKDRRGYKYKEW